MEPGCAKSGAKIEKNASNRPKWLPDGSQDPLTKFKYTILVDFWIPQGTPNGARMHQKWSQNQKNALNRPKWLPDGSHDPFTGNDS